MLSLIINMHDVIDTTGKLKAIFYVTKTNTEDGENYYTPTSIKFDLLFDFSLGANQGWGSTAN